MVKFNEENIEKLAAAIVEDTDMDGVLDMATQGLIDYYGENERDFHDAWLEKFGDVQ